MLIDYKSYIYYLFKNVLSCLINVLSKIRQAKALFIVVLIGVSYCLSTFCTYCFIFCYLIFFYIFFLISSDKVGSLSKSSIEKEEKKIFLYKPRFFLIILYGINI